jgi:hypothetical protein
MKMIRMRNNRITMVLFLTWCLIFDTTRTSTANAQTTSEQPATSVRPSLRRPPARSPNTADAPVPARTITTRQ